jgi:hypothetical protein
MDVDKHKVWLFLGIALAVVSIGLLLLQSDFSFSEGFAGQATSSPTCIVKDYTEFGVYPEDLKAGINYVSIYDFSEDNACFKKVFDIKPGLIKTYLAAAPSEYSCEMIYKGLPIVKVTLPDQEPVYQIMYYLTNNIIYSDVRNSGSSVVPCTKGASYVAGVSLKSGFTNVGDLQICIDEILNDPQKSLDPTYYAVDENLECYDIECSLDTECVDSNPCNIDKCLMGECRHVPHFNPASLNDPLAVQKECCSVSSDCNDENFVVVDSCQEDNQCSYSDKVGNECGHNGDCETGVCINEICQGGKSCLTHTDCFEDENEDGLDDNPSTIDYCHNEICQHVIDPSYVECNEDLDCADEDICTTNTCLNNACVKEDIENCCLTEENCTAGVGGKDNNLCTTDSCNLDTNQCLFTSVEDCCNTEEECNDDKLCTEDQCINHKCRNPVWPDLEIGKNPALSECCNIWSYKCEEGYFCGEGICQEGCGSLTGDCDSGFHCDLETHDCTEGCIYPADCSDGYCFIPENEEVGSCVQCLSDSNCNNDNFCTVDKCENNLCVNTEKDNCLLCSESSECGTLLNEENIYYKDCSEAKCIVEQCRWIKFSDDFLINYPAIFPSCIDTDDDGLTNDADTDDDGDDVLDEIDNCPLKSNPGQEDLDEDGLGDVCDEDTDGDGVLDGADAFPNNILESSDTDGDKTGDNADTDDDNDLIPDDNDNCPLDSNVNQADLDEDNIGDVCDEDTDGDGLTNEEEIIAGSDPNNPASTPDDLDGDGYTNDQEIAADTDPNDAESFPELQGGDLDNDGVNDDIDVCDDTKLGYPLYLEGFSAGCLKGDINHDGEVDDIDILSFFGYYNHRDDYGYDLRFDLEKSNPDGEINELDILGYFYYYNHRP